MKPAYYREMKKAALEKGVAIFELLEAVAEIASLASVDVRKNMKQWGMDPGWGPDQEQAQEMSDAMRDEARAIRALAKDFRGF